MLLRLLATNLQGVAGEDNMKQPIAFYNIVRYVML